MKGWTDGAWEPITRSCLFVHIQRLNASANGYAFHGNETHSGADELCQNVRPKAGRKLGVEAASARLVGAFAESFAVNDLAQGGWLDVVAHRRPGTGSGSSLEDFRWDARGNESSGAAIALPSGWSWRPELDCRPQRLCNCVALGRLAGSDAVPFLFPSFCLRNFWSVCEAKF